VKKKYQPKISTIKDKTGKVLTQKEDVLKRWKDYCEDLYSDDHCQDRTLLQELVHITPPKPRDAQHQDNILLSEVTKAIAKLKNNKGAGVDGIPAELIKNGGDELLAKLHELCCKVWNEERIPEEWGQSILITIPKRVISRIVQITGLYH
jgi:hypothetical protein